MMICAKEAPFYTSFTVFAETVVCAFKAVKFDPIGNSLLFVIRVDELFVKHIEVQI